MKTGIHLINTKIDFLPPALFGRLTKRDERLDKSKKFRFPGATLHRENGPLTQGKIALGQTSR
jgi:hypothetical protein